MAAAVVRLSPVSMTMRMPSARSASRAACVEALTGSAMAMTPAGLPSTPTKIAVAPSARSFSRLGRERAGVDALLLEEAGVAERHALALDGAERALAGGRVRNRSPG